jgi:leucyl aminopeptidase
MLDLRLATRTPRAAAIVALAVAPSASDEADAPADDRAVSPGAVDQTAEDAEPAVTLLGPTPRGIDPDDIAAFLAEVEHTGKAGSASVWVRPRQPISRLILVGVGARGEAGWRSAGAALARKAAKHDALTVLLPADMGPDELQGLAEGAWLASYRFRLRSDDDDAPKLGRITLVTSGPDGGADSGQLTEALDTARVIARYTTLARDLTNTPSDRKTPIWLARQITRKARGITGLTATVRDPARLAADGFGGVVAVGGGSDHGPHLVELSWRPRGAKRHVVLAGKGITFDTGGVCIKPREAMKLMRKDMGGAAAVAAATLAAAALGLRVRITAVMPFAENMLGGAAFRPGDVIHHYGGITSEVRNTDAEGRLVLADALAYADLRLHPDVLVDVATLTGAQGVALGKRTAALFSTDDALAKELTDAAADVGEKMWRLPLYDEYIEALRGDDTDLINAAEVGAGAVMAALFLREFTGGSRDRWAHIDMSAPAWSDSADAELVKNATGWGVRTLVRWLSSLAD